MGRIFYSLLMTETNSFSPLPTTLKDFQDGDFFEGEDVIKVSGKVRPGFERLTQWCATHGCTLIGGLSASAPPGGPTPDPDYQELKDRILSALNAAMPVKAVILNLHGAMQSASCFDCEGDLLCDIRKIVGTEVPIGVVLDPHAHLTTMMIEAASCLIFMKEYPHIDGAERMEELLAIIGDALDSRCALYTAQFDCHLVSFFPTIDAPMRTFVGEMQHAETSRDVASISFIHGFPWGDTPDMGAKLLVYSRKSQAHARSVASALDSTIQRIKNNVLPPMIEIEEAVRLASQSWEKPLVLADVADNPGGGAPSDSTYLLSALLDADAKGVAVGLLFDPEAVAQCHNAGVGKIIDVTLGGKFGQASGEPLQCQGLVRNVAKTARMAVLDGVDFPMGDTAWITVKGVDVILSSLREQMYAPDGFAHLGLDPTTCNCLVVKSSNHFRAFFDPIAARSEYVTSPGAIDFEFSRLPYRHFKRFETQRNAAPAC